MKKCYICKTIKQESEFYHDASKRGGLSDRCRICDNAKRGSSLKRQKTPLRNLVNEKKKSGCYFCGEKNLTVLDMHHKNKKLKKFTISSAINRLLPISLSDFINELNKCIVLCANCHRRIEKGELVL